VQELIHWVIFAFISTSARNPYHRVGEELSHAAELPIV
jgi:hypothetical protein